MSSNNKKRAEMLISANLLTEKFPKDIDWGKCYPLDESLTQITTSDELANFDFQPEWMKTKEYWDNDFETRHESQKKDPERQPLKIIIVPHSHNDPGWLKTFVNYFQADSRQILNYVITQMDKDYKNMTFIWSEISFLQMWWDQAHPIKQRMLKKLVHSGRFEITTGGWVMTDEANVHLYAMLDQLIEGHQWVKTHLNVTPQVGWSIDPFGHGNTVPYLLSASGFAGAIIQRIHYAWKQWFARKQSGDFIWTPYWKLGHSTERKPHSLLTHNMPFDIYSIKGSCGPHPYVCLNFDFRKVPGEYTEYSVKAQNINDDNVQAKADLLMEQYSRTASLFPHNVALIPIGDDFRYNREHEVEQQYTNYKKLVDYINQHKERYGADVQFGTPKDYFKEIKKRMDKFPTLKGDFFVYADIFNEGRPAYWSGYFTTRPFYKIMSRDLEANLRSLEILFTLAFNRARQHSNMNTYKVFEKNYEKMINARRNLGLFQHHDAITGTSKANVMRDYAIRLFESTQDVVKLQEQSLEYLIQKTTAEHNFIINEYERDNVGRLPRKTPLNLNGDKPTPFIIYNSLAQDRFEVLLVRVTTPEVKLLGPDGKEVPFQINPVWNVTDKLDLSRMIVASDKEFELLFVYKLPALSLLTFTLVKNENYKEKVSTLYCSNCKDDKNPYYSVKPKPPGDIQLENPKMRLLFDEQTGFMKSLTKKGMGRSMQCAIKFAAYRSAQFHSGAYLFRPDPDGQNPFKEVLDQYKGDLMILITSGPLASDITAVYGPFLAHTVRIFNTKTSLDDGIFIENDVDFENAPKNRETELFMRFDTDIENGETPEFHSDMNGFQYLKRTKIPSIGIEGNYYPITQTAFIQDDNVRLTLSTTHAQGAASLEPGQLEVMLDRRTLYDDYRGMGEGIVDSRLTRHKFWLTIESLSQRPDTSNSINKQYQVPSLYATHLANSLNYPANIYFVEKWDENIQVDLHTHVSLSKHSFPCDLHLLNLRTLTDPQLLLFPSQSALMVLQRFGHDCHVSGELMTDICEAKQTIDAEVFNKLYVKSVESTSLTGLQNYGHISSISDIRLEPMELRSFNVTFV
uniref:Alpha-mannosidase n=1 Tax=Culicoides sonorensis TaxID=179676 RepID=A0A336MSP4_CULSO